MSKAMPFGNVRPDVVSASEWMAFEGWSSVASTEAADVTDCSGNVVWYLITRTSLAYIRPIVCTETQSEEVWATILFLLALTLLSLFFP